MLSVGLYVGLFVCLNVFQRNYCTDCCQIYSIHAEYCHTAYNKYFGIGLIQGSWV